MWHVSGLTRFFSSFSALSLTLLFFLWACGTSSVPPASTADPVEQCVTVKRSFDGCCLSNGGADACGPTNYVFLGNALKCKDGSLSKTCANE